MRKKIVILVGQTASGKTDLSLKLAKHFSFEIVNADSLQIFRHLNIGTAKPSLQERQTILHHLIDIVDPDETVSSAWYATQALDAINTIHSKNKIPLVVGGSGFYLRALEHPPQGAASSPKHKSNTIDYEQSYLQLKKEDPEIAKQIHPHDHYRIERAIDMIGQGYIPSQQWKLVSQYNPFFTIVWLGLTLDRQILYNRIHQRVEKMFKTGLVQETQNVLQMFPNSLYRLERTIGYRQCLLYLNHRITESQMIEHTKTQTRQYAKRQKTWFQKEKRVHWFEPKQNCVEIINTLERELLL